MKIGYLVALMLILFKTSVQLDDKHFDLVDPEDDHSADNIKPEHLGPDINCLLNNHAEVFGFPKKVMNAFVERRQINTMIDPFMTYIDSLLKSKEEDLDFILTVTDINLYYKIDTEEFVDLRVFLDECAKVPEKFSLTITELNYLYCTILWNTAFMKFGKHLTENKDFKEGFLTIVDNSISFVFNYKTYIKDLKINKYTKRYWDSFYRNLLEFNDLNNNFEAYTSNTIIMIKENNFFFNQDDYIDQNMFFKFYINYEEILRALNKSFFYFYVNKQPLLMKIKDFCDKFEDLLVKELYGSNFYLLMKNDTVFMNYLEKYTIHHNFLLAGMTQQFDVVVKIVDAFIKEEIRRESNFDFSKVLEPPVQANDTPRALPLLNQDLHVFLGLGKKSVDVGDAVEPPKKTTGQIILETKEMLRNEKLYDKDTREWLQKFKLLGDTHPRKDESESSIADDLYVSDDNVNQDDPHASSPPERMLKQVNRVRRSLTVKNDGVPKSEEGEFYHTLKLIEHPAHDEESARKLFELPEQPDISNPSSFFERIDFIKRPLSVKAKRMTLSEFFGNYEEKVKDYYGTFANINLLTICKQNMHVNIPHFSNIFCLILQRETSLLLQQKYNNTKVKAFIDKYFRFITYNFFTYFKILKETDQLIEIEALTLFFAEKFFHSVKLAIVSFNNLLIHFEEEYRDFYLQKLKDIYYPLLNNFKLQLIEVFYKYEEQFTPDRLAKVNMNTDDLRAIFLPKFRTDFEELILTPTISKMNLESLREQYGNYINGMNLLSYDKVKESFMYFSKRTGIQVSSEGPTPECTNIQLSDVVESHKQSENGVDQSEDGLDDDGDEKCIKNWKLYDHVFHYLFYNTSTKKVFIKRKDKVGSPADHNAAMYAMATEMERVVNGFVAPRMQEKLEHFYGDTQADLEICGVLLEYSMIKCFSIFGNNNCRRVPNTIYYTRKCPKGYVAKGLGCTFACEPHKMDDGEEFCVKQAGKERLPCPTGTTPKGKNKCLKPMRKYFAYIMNPFNNKL